jgi:uncharacterized membrane protein
MAEMDKINPLAGLIFLMCGLSIFAERGSATPLPEVVINRVLQGETVVEEHQIPNRPWPRIVVYKEINAPPEAVLALFADYENAPKFAKNLRSAEVTSVSSDNKVKDVKYTVNVPILPDIQYKVRNTVSHIKSGAYRVSWERVDSDLFERIEGSLLIYPSDGKTIVRYESVLEPSTDLVAPLKGFVAREAKQIMENFASLVESPAQN